MAFLAQSNPENYWTKPEVEAILTTAKKLYDTPRTRRIGIGGLVIDPADNGETYILFKWLWLSGRRLCEVIGTDVTYGKTLKKRHKKTWVLPGLTVGDINFDDCKVSYRIEKKKKPVLVSFIAPSTFLLEVANFLDKKGILNNKEAKIFTLSKRTYQNRIMTCLEQAAYTGKDGELQSVKWGPIGINRRQSIHTFRHSFINFARRVLDVAELKYAAQHSSADITLSYAHPDEKFSEKLYTEML